MKVLALTIIWMERTAHLDERKFFDALLGRTVKAHECISFYYRSDGENCDALPYEYLKAKIFFSTRKCTYLGHMFFITQ